MRLRKAAKADCKRLWLWRNEPEVRASAVNSAEISWEEHLKWFTASLKNPNRKIWIIEDKKPIGQVRIDIYGSMVTFDISLIPEARNRGIGTWVINEVCKKAKRMGLKKAVAIIRKTNPRSSMAFSGAGFYFSQNQRSEQFTKYERDL